MSCSMACVKLEEYHTAKAALETGASLAQDDNRFTKFIKECDQKIAGIYILALTFNIWLS